MVVNKVKESFLLHTENYGHFAFHFLDFESCFCHFDAYYIHLFALPPRPPSTLCLQLCHALLLLHGLCFHLISPSSCLNPAAGKLCGTLLLAAIQSLIGMAGADFNLVTFEQWAPSGGSPDNMESLVNDSYQLHSASTADIFMLSEDAVVTDFEGKSATTWLSLQRLTYVCLKQLHVPVPWKQDPGGTCGGVSPYRMSSLSAR